MVDRDLDLPAAERVRFRIGVNLGDVIADGEDIYGDGVNVAARLEGLAEPGGVCVSGKVYDEIRGKLDLDFEDLGEPALKNIARPVRAWRVADAAAVVTRRVAGLPFADPGEDPEPRSSGDGPTEGVIVDLARFRRREPPASPAARPVPDGSPFPVSEHNLPQPNSNFVGRTVELETLRQALTATGRSAITQSRQAISGLGGIGKTQLALAYAYAHLGDYDLVRWLRAEEPSVLAADYAAMAPALGLDRGMPDQAALVTAIRGKLERTDRWLLVFDNAGEPGALDPYLPRTGGGHVLVTSRWQDWRARPPRWSWRCCRRPRPWRCCSEKVPATRPSAPRQRSWPRSSAACPGPGAGAGVHAGAQAGRRRLSPATRRGPTQGAGVAAAQRRLSHGGRAGVAGVARPSRPRLPGGGRADGAPGVPWPGRRPTRPARRQARGAAGGAARPIRPRQRHRGAGRFSLVRVEPDCLTVHRLVQAVTRERLDEAMSGSWAATAVALVNAALPPPTWDNVHRPAIEKLLPQALAAAEAAERFGVGLDGVGAILTVVGEYLTWVVAPADAEPLLRRAVAAREQALGPEHPDLAISLHKLATACDWKGRPTEAEPLYWRVLTVRSGHSIPSTLLSRKHWAASASSTLLLAAAPRPIRLSSAHSPSTSGPSGRSTPTSPSPCSTWLGSIEKPAARRQPSRFTNVRSPSPSEPSAPSTSALPDFSTIWPDYAKRAAAMPRPSRCSSARSQLRNGTLARRTPIWPSRSTA